MKKATVVIFFVVAAMMLDLGISNEIHETVHTVGTHHNPVVKKDTFVEEKVVVQETAPAHHVHETIVKKNPAVVDKTVVVKQEPTVVHETVLQKPPTVEEIDIIEEFEVDDK